MIEQVVDLVISFLPIFPGGGGGGGLSEAGRAPNTYDVYDIGTIMGGINESNDKTPFPRFYSSMETIKKTIDTTDNYYTAVLYGPIEINTDNSSYHSRSSYSLRNTLTFQMNVYKNNSYLLNGNTSYTTTFTQHMISHENPETTDISDIIPITDGFIFFEVLRNIDTYTFSINMKKMTINNSEEWSIVTINLSQGIEYYLSSQDYVNPNFKWELLNEGTTLMLAYRARSKYYYIQNPDEEYTVWFINISTGEFIHNSDSGLATNFMANVHNKYALTSSYPPLQSPGEITSSSNQPEYLRGLLEYKYIQIDSKEFLYIFDYNFY